MANVETLRIDPSNDWSGQTSDLHESKNLGDDLIQDLDSYLTHKRDRLTVSRMVNNSIIKGMVNAKELEVASMKEFIESSIEEWKADFNIRKEVETIIFSSVFKGFQTEYEKQIWVVSYAHAFIERVNELSEIRHELDSIEKCFLGPQIGNVDSQRSSENHNVYHNNASTSRTLSFDRLGNRNGTWDEFINDLPENLENSPLEYMDAPQLYQYFKNLIIDMKNEHESTMKRVRRERFSLTLGLFKEKELLKERETLVTFKKDIDCETLRKKISEVIAKLDDIIQESENFQHFRAEKNLHKLVGEFKCTLEDEHIETIVREEIYKCIIRDKFESINSKYENLDPKSIIKQDVLGIVNGEVNHGGVESKLDNEDSELQFLMGQKINEIVFQEVVRDLSMEINETKEKSRSNDKNLGFFQRKVSEIENELKEKEDATEELTIQTFLLKVFVKEKHMFSHEIMDFYEKEREKWMEEKIKFREQEAHKNTELKSLMDKLEDCEKQIEKLNSELKSSLDKLKINDEKMNYISVLNQNLLASIKEKENEHIEYMESLGRGIQSLTKSFTDFELKIKESNHQRKLRLDNSASQFQLHSLISKNNIFRRTRSWYVKRLLDNLHKAEAEVDVLGDQVYDLVRLLEKIRVALHQYSPVLQHYPGIIEVLKLIKIKLREDPVKCHL